MKKISIILFLIFNIFFIKNTQAIDREIIKTKFFAENIYFSQEKFEEGDKIKINTKIFNHSKYEFSGVVVFFDDDIFLGKKDFKIKNNNINTVIGIDWVASAGEHVFFARIEKVKFLIFDSKKNENKSEEAYLVYNETDQKMHTVPKKKVIEKEKLKKDAPENSLEKEDTKNKTGDDSRNSTEGIFKDIEDKANSLGEFIEEKTPNFIKNPIIASSEKIENFRKDAGFTLKDKKNEIKKELDNLNNNLNTDSSEKSDHPFYLKPFKYVESFFSTLSSAIFNNKILFYSFLIIIFFYLVRFIWRMI